MQRVSMCSALQLLITMERSPAILPQYSTPSSNSLYKEIDEFWTIKFDSPISRPEKSAYIMVMDSSGTKYAKYDAANPDEVEFPAGDPTIARYKALKNLEAGTYLVSLDKGFSVTLNACMLCKVLHSSSAFRYVFSILVKPRIDLEECSVIAPGETWNSVVTALIPKDSDASIQKGSGAQNVTEIQGSLPYGMIMSYVKDSEPGKKVVKAKLSFRPNEEGTYIFNFTATDNNGAQSYPKAGYLIVSAYGFPMNVNVDPPVLLPEFSNPSCNFLYEGREEFWTIKFDSPVTRPTRWKAFIKIQDMNTTKVIAKYNALDMNVVRFSDSDPTIVKYPAPTAVLGDRVYRVDVDLGFVVRVFGTPCGRNHIAVGEGGMYNFQTSKRPEVECGESYIKVRIPKTYVNNIPASELHLHDTRCRIQDNHPMYYQIEFGYDECGTIIKHLSQSKTTFYNTIRDDPKPILPDVPITRAKHNVEIQIICEMRGLGGNDVFFKTAADVKPDIYKANGKFKTYRKMYEDSSYNRDITGTASVELKEKLYFAAHSTSSKEVAIESCRAMPKFGTCTHNNTVYTIIKNGCGVGPSAVSLSSSGLDHRFSIKSFGFMHYDLTNEVFMKCKIVSCKPASNSRCADLKSGNCSSRRRRGAIIEEESDTFMTFKIL
ncbi:uncharacterized protein [Antedon mediterranea]|uniref:uncharacterized protein isoform X2 n=1 Tax=Antedon mediterranea TaxID=105859 RepID=UPI003AF4A6B4